MLIEIDMFIKFLRTNNILLIDGDKLPEISFGDSAKIDEAWFIEQFLETLKEHLVCDYCNCEANSLISICEDCQEVHGLKDKY